MASQHGNMYAGTGSLNVALLFLILPEPVKGAYQALMIEVLSSFQWERQAPVPENLYLSYNTFGNFEFAVPIDGQPAFQMVLSAQQIPKQVQAIV